MDGPGIGGREVSVVLWFGLVFSECVLMLSLFLLPSSPPPWVRASFCCTLLFPFLCLQGFSPSIFFFFFSWVFADSGEPLRLRLLQNYSLEKAIWELTALTYLRMVSLSLVLRADHFFCHICMRTSLALTVKFMELWLPSLLPHDWAVWFWLSNLTSLIFQQHINDSAHFFTPWLPQLPDSL